MAKTKTSTAKIMRKAALFYSAFPTEFFEQIEKISEEMGITATDIIVNICLNQVAADNGRTTRHRRSSLRHGRRNRRVGIEAGQDSPVEARHDARIVDGPH